MKDGFIRVAAATPEIRTADVDYNKEQVAALMKEAAEKGSKITVFPELVMSGYECRDLFLQETLLKACQNALKELIKLSESLDGLYFIGLPWEKNGNLYNITAAVSGGCLLALIPKTNIPNYSEFYEKRYFRRGNGRVEWIPFTDADDNTYNAAFGTNILLKEKSMPQLVVSAEICEDVWAADSPSICHTLAGATVIANSSASDEVTGKADYREALISSQSARLVCAYIYANAGEGESTTDLVFSGHNIIAENGNLLNVSKTGRHGITYADIDLGRLASERRRMTTYAVRENESYTSITFEVEKEDIALERFIDPMPFVPSDPATRQKRCEEILDIQSLGLKKRLKHTQSRCALVGLSGGLDSTLALLVTVRAFDALSMPRGQIQAITMPCFGTTDRTYQNACRMAKVLGATLTEIDIRESVRKHFEDIGQDENVHDVAYENSQARERTQILMDLANRLGGLVIGTGDLSELALGWATYNGDHMSMYAVNSSVPKTLVRHLVRYYAETCGEELLHDVLMDVLDTPVSPELLPPKEGQIAQKTEDIVGPYELHDFYLYYVVRYGYSPAKIFRLAQHAFSEYDKEIILKWLKTFYRRFFSQQYKRSCLPDGPKVGSVALSPRGDWRMPSDAVSRLWMDELEKL